MITNLTMLPLVMSSVVILNMASTYKNIIMCLLNLEILTLILLMCYMMLSFNSYLSTPYIMTILTMAACEGSLGLSILVLTMRAYGNDLIKSISIMVC